jgi:hypothetical protein
MDQLLGISGGGDKKSPQAKVATAKREQQIVELRLRNVSFPDIARDLGISEPGAVRAFYRAIRRQTADSIQAIHRSEGAKLDMAEARLHKALDANKNNWKAVEALSNSLIRLYQRRARLFGLDAPQKVDIRGIYPSGTDERSAEQHERERIIEAIPLDEQERMFEVFEAARKRAKFGTLAIETTAIPIGPNGIDDHRADATDGAESGNSTEPRQE